jgi:hypothetical protein
MGSHMSGFARRALGLMRTLVLPLLVVTVTQTAMRTTASLCGEEPHRNRTWVRWDSYRYIDIARQGYVIVPKDPLASNTAWFPGYPLVMRLVAEATPMRIALAGRVVSAAFLLAFLAVLGGALFPAMRWPQRLLALMVAGFFPGWMYWHAVFPQSMLVFFSLGAIALGARGRYLPAGLLGALGAFTYPTGALVVVPLGVEVALANGLTVRQRVAALVKGPGVASLGLAATFAMYQAQVGQWDAYIRFQKQFGQGLSNPAAVLAGHLSPLLSLPASAETLVAGQTAVATLLLLVGALVLWSQREQLRPVDAALLAYGIAVWVFVNAAGPSVSIYRQAAALVCVVPLLARLRPAMMVGLLFVLVPLALGMAVLFFRNVLI